MADIVDDLNVTGEGLEQSAPKVLQTLKTIMLSMQLINEKCFQTIFIESSYFDVPCLKLVRAILESFLAEETFISLILYTFCYMYFIRQN